LFCCVILASFLTSSKSPRRCFRPSVQLHPRGVVASLSGLPGRSPGNAFLHGIPWPAKISALVR
jgi:hypothetical protein